ncbi:hypothetical protein R1sor_002155 [Riccia sorocarpa]|uniref:HMA domain-containing protein n=1 Tax=Riccia sorocarpa TaxID=122646 RepID=A0ABD3GYC6_9MARC
MYSVNDVFYNSEEQPVRVLGSSYGHGSSRYSDNDYSHSPRLMHQYSRGRTGAYNNDYRYSRNSSFGRNAYSPPGRYHGSHHTDYRTPESDSYGNSYGSSGVYHGQHTSTVPRTYQSTSYYKYATNSYALQTVRLKVPICCEACEERITNRLLAVEGVQSVTCDQIQQKVIVSGTADPSEILRASKDCFKHSKYWRDY